MAIEDFIIGAVTGASAILLHETRKLNKQAKKDHEKHLEEMRQLEEANSKVIPIDQTAERVGRKIGQVVVQMNSLQKKLIP